MRLLESSLPLVSSATYMSLILESDKRIFHDLVQKIEDSAISNSESTELDALILKYLPSLKKAAEERLGVHIKNIIFFCTQEERSTIKQLKTTKTKRNTVIIAAEDARRWFQLQGLLLRRILAASGETLDIDSGSLSSTINPNIHANGSILRSRWNSQGGAGDTAVLIKFLFAGGNNKFLWSYSGM